MKTGRLRLLFALDGRLRRRTFWYAATTVLGAFFGLLMLLESVIGLSGTLLLHPALFWTLGALTTKRYHDVGKSGVWAFLLLVPVLGPFWVFVELGLRRGTRGENRFGPDPRVDGIEYFVVPTSAPNVVNDISGLNPITVGSVVTPRSVEEIRQVLRETDGPVSVGGGRFSMGGQTASPGSLHLDLRKFDQVVAISPTERTIRVQTGICWSAVQRALDAHDLSVQIMQTYANFTVGGALSVNAHGRYVGLGPLILSVRSIAVVLHDGSLVRAAPTENAELFYGAIGGYGGLGVIVEAELALAENLRVARVHRKLPIEAYRSHFEQQVRGAGTAVFHNGDLYPPHFNRVRSVTWMETKERVTNPQRLQQPQERHLLMRYLQWAVAETPLGRWRREHVFEPLALRGKTVHWRNFEAGYDVRELEPGSRETTTYVLNEYFVPVAQLEAFVPRMAEIFQRYDVNVLNVSLRHASADPGSLLAWAREEVFALVVYFKHGCDDAARGEVAVWNRQMVDCLLDVGGSYYLPYEIFATPEQFHRAYPRAREWWALKARLDPEFRFRNALWDTYGERGSASASSPPNGTTGLFHPVFDDVTWRDRFYLFLQNIYRLVPEDRFHALIRSACAEHQADDAIYAAIQAGLPSIQPFAAGVRFALPSLSKQKRVIREQTLELLGERRHIDGYVEIGTTGRYAGDLRRHVKFRGPLFLVNDVAPSNSPIDMFERGGVGKVGRFVPLDDYAPLPAEHIADGSIDVVTCYIGLHHAPDDALGPFIHSIRRVLRPGGLFVVREHDCATAEMTTFVSLVHTVFNAGLGVPWEIDQAEVRRFVSVDTWVQRLEQRGFADTGARLLQDHDPSANTLLAFTKTAAVSS